MASNKERCKQHCLELLESRNLKWVFDEAEFNRMFRGNEGLNPFTVALHLQDNLIFSAHYKQLSETTN